MNEAEGIEPGVARAVQRGDRPRAGARRRGRGVLAAALGRVRPRLLLPVAPAEASSNLAATTACASGPRGRDDFREW